MDKIIRCITSDGAVMASAIDASDIVFKAQKIHGLSRSATAALGRLLCATTMMGAMLKQKDASINLRVSGDGELGPVIAVADSKGNVRGYVGNANCPTEYYNNGKINVSKAVGKNGVLNVMRDYGSGDPYIGQVELVSGEIAEDITNYFATSEQIPTVCALGVLINKEDGEVMLAGGLLIQLLPGAFEDTIEKLEKNLPKIQYSNKEFELTEKARIQVETKEYSEKDITWWNNFGISLTTLKKYKVFSIKHVFLNGNYFTSSSDTCPIFGYFGGIKDDIEQ